MSRQWNFRNCFLTILAAGVTTTACTTGDEYAPRQPITMGPWTFQVERATERIENHGNLRFKMISVTLKLENYMERHEKPFDDFMKGRTEGSIMEHPHLALVDEAGNSFDAEDVSPLSGGSLRSESWSARFPLIEFSMRESSSETAARHIEKHPADFRLVIENPDHRSGQPRKVSIQLE
jgi:hypothetical protein